MHWFCYGATLLADKVIGLELLKIRGGAIVSIEVTEPSSSY